MPEVQQRFVAGPKSVGDARRFVRRVLAVWDAEDWAEPASAAVSELATNSVLHARTGFAVELSFQGEILRIGVSDGSSRAPVAKAHSAHATTGRGLEVVKALSVSWGVIEHPEGKTVWCMMARSQPSSLPSESQIRAGRAMDHAHPSTSVSFTHDTTTGTSALGLAA